MKMRNVGMLLVCAGMLLGCGQNSNQPSSLASREKSYSQAMAKLDAAGTPEERFYALDDAAWESLAVEKVDQAQKYAQELLELSSRFKDNWNYGNAIQDSNLVLGLIALREGKIDRAQEYLLAAGHSPGSPQMNSFGPNLSLARELLELGEKEVVLEYFGLCRKFWKKHPEKLEDWTKEVKAGKIPDFGPNLIY